MVSFIEQHILYLVNLSKKYLTSKDVYSQNNTFWIMYYYSFMHSFIWRRIFKIRNTEFQRIHFFISFYIDYKNIQERKNLFEYIKNKKLFH